MGTELLPSMLVLPGSITSHEIDTGLNPILLSQSFQAKLGFVKNSRTGGITLLDYPGQQLEVARQARTGLFMIRIDHLSVDQWHDTFGTLDRDNKAHYAISIAKDLIIEKRDTINGELSNISFV